MNPMNTMQPASGSDRQPPRRGLRRAVLCAALAVAATGPAWAADAPAATAAKAAEGTATPSGRIEVRYRDVNRLIKPDLSMGANTDWVEGLSRYMAKEAERTVPAGHRLVVTIDDVQRAGSYEPGRHSGMADARIVREHTPPSIELSFMLYSPQGLIVKQGDRKLRDPRFMTRLRHRGEVLGYEKNLVDDWLQQEFGPARP